MLIQVADVDFGYPGTELFTGLSFQVNPGDRVGLVGPNGCGKSTLLRLLDGQLEPDRGQVARTRGTTVAYLRQSQEFQGEGRILEALLKPFSHLLEISNELSSIERALEQDHSDAKLLERYGELQESFTQKGGYALESRVKALAHDLGFSDEDLLRSVDTLSGGERGRLELAKTLLAAPDLLLLDEPTNHLDVEATEHLEERLRQWPGAFVLVSHDRYFLRAVCRDIVELEDGEALVFKGGWDSYLVEREQRHTRMQAAFERQRDEIAKTEDFIRRNIAGQNTKQAQGRRKLLARVERLAAVRDEFRAAGQIGLRFQVGDHPGGKDAIRARAVETGYGDGPALVKDLTLTIYRGDRMGLVGPNGCGKSTLLKTLLGKLPPRAGEVELGHEVRLGYFDQKLSDLDEEHSLIDEIRQVRGDFNEDVARNFLARFRFFGDDPFRKVKGLSGGERNRLALAKMMLRPRNLLALDEPTNHLDIPAREVLESALAAYAGTLLVVSHDRFFLDRVVTKILHLDGHGGWQLHTGNWTDWRARDQPKPSDQPVAKPEPVKVERQVERAQRRGEAKDKDRELARKRKRLGDLESKIAQAEAEIARLQAALTGAHGGDWQKLHGLVDEQKKIEAQLKSWMSEWERLGAELEESAKS